MKFTWITKIYKNFRIKKLFKRYRNSDKTFTDSFWNKFIKKVDAGVLDHF